MLTMPSANKAGSQMPRSIVSLLLRSIVCAVDGVRLFEVEQNYRKVRLPTRSCLSLIGNPKRPANIKTRCANHSLKYELHRLGNAKI